MKLKLALLLALAAIFSIDAESKRFGHKGEYKRHPGVILDAELLTQVNRGFLNWDQAVAQQKIRDEMYAKAYRTPATDIYASDVPYY